MADGKIVIDIDIPVDKVKTDAQLIDQVLNALGKDAGKELDNSFEQSSNKVKQEADETSKEVNQKLSKPVQFKWTLDNKDVKDKTQQTDEEIKSVPKEVETKFSAVTDEAKSKTVELQNAFKAVPKSTETKNEVNNSDAKAKVEETKKELDSVPKDTKTKQTADNADLKEKAQQSKEEVNKVPKKHNTDLDATDKTKKATDSASKNADNAGKHFSKLHEIIKGTFIGNFAANAVQAGLSVIKNTLGGVITEGTHYNRLQQDMLAQWTTLTGSAGKGKELVKETNDLAIAAQNSTEMVNDLNQKFYAVTNSASKTRELSKSVLTLQDAFGQSDDAVKNFAMQWSQMIGNGKANAQDMMSIQNVFPKFMEELVAYEQKVTHNSKLTTSQVRDMMSQGKISADAMNTVLIGMGKKYKNATDNFSQTMDGMERTIHARIPVLAGAIVKPFQELKNPLLGKMSNWITSSGAEKSFENFGKSIAGIMNGVMTVINTFAVSFKAIGIFAKGAFSGIVTVFQDISSAIGKVASKLADIIPPMNNTNKAVDGVTKHRAAIEKLGKVFGGLITVILAGKGTWAVLDKMRFGFLGIANTFSKIAKGKTLIEGLAKAFPNLTKAIKGVKEAFDLLKLAFMTNPFMATVAVIVALGLAFYEAYKHIKPFREWVNKAAATVRKSFDGMVRNVEAFNKSFVKGLKAVIDWVKKNWLGLALLIVNPIAGGLKLLYDNNPKFKKWVDSLGKTFKKGWDGMLKAGHNCFKGLLTGISNWGKDTHKWYDKFNSQFQKNWNKGWSSAKKNLINSFNGMKRNTSNWGSNIHKWYDDFNKNFSKKWNNGWSNAKKNLVNSFDDMKRNTSNWGSNIHKWYDDFNKNFSKKWNNGWSDARKNLSNAWSKMQDRTSRFGSGMHDWLSNFGSRFKAGWKSLSRGVRNIFGDMWDAMKRLGKNAMGGLIDIVNAGISGINTVIHAFGGSSHTIKRIPKRFASGTGAFSGPRRAITEPTLAMVNDGFDSPETGNKEALFRPSTGEFGIFQGRNTTAMLMPGDEVLNASETAMVMQGMGITHFAKGTGFMGWLGGIGSWISNTAGHLKDLFNMATKIVAHPINYVKDIFNFKGFNSGKRSMKALASGLFDQANKYVQTFWKTLWSMVSAKLDGGGAEGGLLGAVEKYGKGKPYVWGAEGPDAFDCSGLVKYALEKSFGKSFPHYSGDQYAMSQGVSNPQIGDLVFFGPGGRNHVGVYAGNGKIWSAMSPSSGIGMANVSDFHEGAVSYRRIPGLKNENGEGTVKANSNLEKFIKNLPGMSGFFKFIGKISDLFGIAADAKDPAGTGADRWGEDIKKAAETMHTSVTPTEIRKIISMIAGESGGNPRVTQPGADPDGDGSGPARGLLQYKTSTFNHYKVQGHGNIYHGWDQLLALFNDSNWRNDIHFGAGWGPTGHRRFSGSWHGNGGEFDKPEVIGVGEDGPEFVINPQKSTADHLINKAILQRAKVAPESPTASLARIMEQVKYSSVAGYGTPDSNTVAGQNIVKVNNQGQAIDGNTVIKFIVSDKEMARATYPTIKMLQAHDITIKQQGGAVPIV